MVDAVFWQYKDFWDAKLGFSSKLGVKSISDTLFCCSYAKLWCYLDLEAEGSAGRVSFQPAGGRQLSRRGAFGTGWTPVPAGQDHWYRPAVGNTGTFKHRQVASAED